MSKGLIGGHCYGVTRAFPDGGRMKIEMINPWGKYVRAYNAQNQSITCDPDAGTSRGVMSLDVRTISARFECYHFCKVSLS